MANHNIKDPKEFSIELRKLETSDPAHADTFNPLYEKLINNDAYLKQEVDRKETPAGAQQKADAAEAAANVYTDQEVGVVDQALIAHKAETAYKHINESGNNENGRYLKFDDGTLVIWKMIQQTVPASNNNMYSFTFPASFIYSAIGSVNITAMLTTASVDAAKAAVMRAMPTSGSTYNIGLKNDATSEQTITFYVMAIGRWK